MNKNNKDIVINEETIRKMAKLARIEIPDEDIAVLVKQFRQIMKIFSTLEKIDSSTQSDDVSTIPVHLRLRPDNPQKSLSVADALKASSRRDGSFIVVPRIIDTGEEQ